MPQADPLCLRTYLFYSYMPNYGNIAWASTHKTKLEKVQSKQKHGFHIILNQPKTSPSEFLFLRLSALNVYQIKIFQSVQFCIK